MAQGTVHGLLLLQELYIPSSKAFSKLSFIGKKTAILLNAYTLVAIHPTLF